MADPYASKDLEDIASLLDGCGELEQGVSEAKRDVRHRISQSLQRIGSDASARAALLGQLPRGGDAEAQAKRVLALLERLTQG